MSVDIAIAMRSSNHDCAKGARSERGALTVAGRAGQVPGGLVALGGRPMRVDRRDEALVARVAVAEVHVSQRLEQPVGVPQLAPDPGLPLHTRRGRDPLLLVR